MYIVGSDLGNENGISAPDIPAGMTCHPLEERPMKKIIPVALLGLLLAVPAAPQSSQQAATQNPLSTWLRNSYMRNRTNIAKAAEEMPEDFYNLRPGPQTEVRTFGQIVGHLANFNYMLCADAKEEKNPYAGTDFEKVTSKSGLVKAINGAFAYCDSAYAALTDASAMQWVHASADNGGQPEVLRVNRLIFNFSHNNEHYGNLVTYMRIKSLVPPSSAPRTATPARGM
jgi:Tfp pilus assembly protein PilV